MSHEAVPIRFAGNPAGIEVLRASQLRRRMGSQLHRYERLDFTLYLLPLEGTGTHSIDFIDHECRAGRLIRVTPGRVHRFEKDGTFEADLLLVHPRGSTQRSLRTQPAFDLSRADEDALRGLLTLLNHLLGVDEVNVTAAQSLVAAWTSIVEALPSATQLAKNAPTADWAYAFTSLVEDNFTHWRRVEDYARALSCSDRTLVRATLAVHGLTPKQLLDDRVMLEARRLLALTDQNVEGIGRYLGYEQASNFTAAFRRVVGTTPREFRRRQLP